MDEMTVSFTGPRKLYNSYNINHPNWVQMRNILIALCDYLIDNHDVVNFVSGGALGVDTQAFLAVNEIKKRREHIKNILALPIENWEIKWTEGSKALFKKMKEHADFVTIVDTLEKYMLKNVPVGEYHGAKPIMRNEYMVDNSDILVAVWDGVEDEHSGTYRTVRYAYHQNRTTIFINPNDYKIYRNQTMKTYRMRLGNDKRNAEGLEPLNPSAYGIYYDNSSTMNKDVMILLPEWQDYFARQMVYTHMENAIKSTYNSMMIPTGLLNTATDMVVSYGSNMNALAMRSIYGATTIKEPKGLITGIATLV